MRYGMIQLCNLIYVIKQKVGRQSVTNTGLITFLGLHLSYIRHNTFLYLCLGLTITSVKYLYALILF